jgi:hypothetical protein
MDESRMPRAIVRVRRAAFAFAVIRMIVEAVDLLHALWKAWLYGAMYNKGSRSAALVVAILCVVPSVRTVRVKDYRPGSSRHHPIRRQSRGVYHHLL